MHRVIEMLGVDEAEANGLGVTVAVLDTGVDVAHGNLAPAIDRDRSVAFTLDGDLRDTVGHGSHVAGIIAGSGQGPERRYRGIAPMSKLIVVKVFGSSGRALSSAVARGIEYATDAHVDVINYSATTDGWAVTGGLPPWVWPERRTVVEDAFADAANRGVVCVCSAGNYGPTEASVEPPGAMPGVLSVGAIGWNKNVVRASARGPFYRSPAVAPGEVLRGIPDGLNPQPFVKPDLVAPGGEFNAIDDRLDVLGRIRECPHGVIAPRAKFGRYRPLSPLQADVGYTRIGGTSQAAAVVSGLVALSIDYARRRNLNWGQRRSEALINLFHSAAGRDHTTESDNAYGWGRITWPAIREKIDACVEDDDLRWHILTGGQLKLL